jgi:hypothetical protein
MIRTSAGALVAAIVFAVVFATGCAQVTGQLRDEPVIDLLPSSALEGSCPVTILERRERDARDDLVEVGVLTVEGPLWLVREDVEAHARHRACGAGASHVVIGRERYGTPVLGSSAEVRLYRQRDG